MTPAGFEAAIPRGERPQNLRLRPRGRKTHALNRAATAIGLQIITQKKHGGNVHLGELGVDAKSNVCLRAAVKEVWGEEVGR
jgi:hypothetical protein